jgi:hypothetical protein
MREASIENLYEDPGIKLMQQRSNEYKESTLKQDSQTYALFHKTKGAYYAIALFMHKKQIVSVSIAGYSAENFDPLLKDVLTSLHLY